MMKMNNICQQVGNLTIKIDEWEIEEGKIHGLMGPNGCGKTTLAKLLLNLKPLQQGTVSLNGLECRDITLASQRPYLMHDTVYENIIYPLKLRKQQIDEAEIDKILDRFSLKDKKHTYARSLSSGERQKLSIIRAVIFCPKLIVIDESFSNLDIESTMKIEEWIREKQKEENSTWIIISHQVAQLKRLCHTIHFMDQGEILVSENAQEIFSNTSNQRLREFLEFQTGIF